MVRLNAVALLGRTIEWTVSTALAAIMLVQLVLIAAALIAFAYLEMRKRSSAKRQSIFAGYTAVAEKEHNLIGITLDLSAVRRQFAPGEAFDAEGLVVTANYDSEPYSEQVQGFSVEAPERDMYGESRAAVRYGGFTEYYPVTFFSAEEERHAVGIELDLGTVRTDFLVGEAFDGTGLSVTVRYDAPPYEQRTDDFTIDPPDLSEKGMKNVAVHSHGFTQTYPVFVAEGRALIGLTLGTDAVRREFKVGEAFDSTGLVVTAEYDAEPFSETAEEYEMEAPDLSKAGEAEVRVRLKGLTASYFVTVTEEPAPAEEIVPAEEIAPAEELTPGEGEVLRYDRSFTARLIQTDEDTKRRYSALKNELLAYEGVKCRMSWRKETFRVGGGHVARIGFRGNLLCLFLPVDPAEYADSRYKVENAATGRSDDEMPCLFRIKNDKRARLAADLIERVMTERGIEKTDRPARDYTMPYETTEQLQSEGLVRAVIKSRVDDSMFAQKDEDGE